MTTTNQEASPKFSPFRKQARLEKIIHEAAAIKADIESERRSHRREEYELATEQLRSARPKLRRAALTVFLDRVDERLKRNQTVSGFRPAKDGGFIDLETLEWRDNSHGASKFQVMKVHRGSKHLGLWCKFDGESRLRFVDARDFRKIRRVRNRVIRPDYVLDCGLAMEPSEIEEG